MIRVKELPILPISRVKCEFNLDTQNPRVFFFDQLKTLIKRMALQLYRNRVKNQTHTLINLKEIDKCETA